MSTFYGNRPECRDCTLASQKQYRDNNKQKISERKKVWREANKDQVAATQKNWRQVNADRVRKNERAWREANRERAQAVRRAWVDLNRGVLRSFGKGYMQKAIEEMKPHYIAALIGLPVVDLPPELIEVKREQLLMHRLITDLKKVIQGESE